MKAILKLEKCFYCDTEITHSAMQKDHFPIPARHGGKETVPCCIACHDMKDRYLLQSWPSEWWQDVLLDWPKMSRATRIYFAKMGTLFLDYVLTKKKKNESKTTL